MFVLAALLSWPLPKKKKESVVIRVTPHASERVLFGVDRLKNTLEDLKYKVIVEKIASANSGDHNGKIYWILERGDSLAVALAGQLGFPLPDSLGNEGFYIDTDRNHTLVYGKDSSGALYGCYELSDILSEGQPLPVKLWDAPEMVMRGACIGLQKPYYLPGRTVYEYPYTPETFPWFYDKDVWIEYLDMLVENRMNSLYLWNGHPFASLVKLDDYPFALEVNEETFRKNEEIFSFLTEEADKRGIYVIQMFYNIIVSKPLLNIYGIPNAGQKQAHHAADSGLYTKVDRMLSSKSIPMRVCWSAGEALATYEEYVAWFTKTALSRVSGMD